MIIAGFVGVGKTRAAMEWDNCINIQLSPLHQFQPENPPGRQAEALKKPRHYIPNPLYPYNAILEILKAEAAGKWVIITAVKSVLVPLAKEYQRKCILAYPAISLREEYEKRYRLRGNTDAFVRRMMELWDSRLQFLNEFGYGSIHLPLKSGGCYLTSLRSSLEKQWENAQPPVSFELLHELERKVDSDSISYYLTDSQSHYALPVDLRSDALREYLYRAVVEGMPRPTLVRQLPDGVIQVETLEEFMEAADLQTRSRQVRHDC